MVMRRYADGIVRWTGCTRIAMDNGIIRHESPAYRVWPERSRVLPNTIMATPAANGNATIAISLSASISHRIFAKIAINFITLQRLTDKFVTIIIS